MRLNNAEAIAEDYQLEQEKPSPTRLKSFFRQPSRSKFEVYLQEKYEKNNMLLTRNSEKFRSHQSGFRLNEISLQVNSTSKTEPRLLSLHASLVQKPVQLLRLKSVKNLLQATVGLSNTTSSSDLRGGSRIKKFSKLNAQPQQKQMFKLLQNSRDSRDTDQNETIYSQRKGNKNAVSSLKLRKILLEHQHEGFFDRDKSKYFARIRRESLPSELVVSESAVAQNDTSTSKKRLVELTRNKSKENDGAAEKKSKAKQFLTKLFSKPAAPKINNSSEVQPTSLVMLSSTENTKATNVPTKKQAINILRPRLNSIVHTMSSESSSSEDSFDSTHLRPATKTIYMLTAPGEVREEDEYQQQQQQQQQQKQNQEQRQFSIRLQQPRDKGQLLSPSQGDLSAGATQNTSPATNQEEERRKQSSMAVQRSESSQGLSKSGSLLMRQSFFVSRSSRTLLSQQSVDELTAKDQQLQQANQQQKRQTSILLAGADATRIPQRNSQRASVVFNKFRVFSFLQTIIAGTGRSNSRLQAENDRLQPKTSAQLNEQFVQIMRIVREKMQKQRENSCTQTQKQFEIIGEQQLTFFEKFVKFALMDRPIAPDEFLKDKLTESTYTQLKVWLLAAMQQLSFIPEVLEEWDRQLEKGKSIILYGKVLDEIGGNAGLHRLLTEALELWGSLCASHRTNLISTAKKYSETVFAYIYKLLNEEEHLLDLAAAKSACASLGLTYEDFFLAKYAFYRVLCTRQVSYRTLMRFLEKLERFRYNFEVRQYIETLLTDQELRLRITQYFIYEIDKDKELQRSLLLHDNALIRELSYELVQEFVYQQRGQWDIVLFMQNLLLQQKNESLAVDKLSQHLCHTLELFKFDKQFVNDVRVRLQKLKYRLGIAQSPLKLLGGVQGVKVLLLKMTQNVLCTDLFYNFLSRFPEEIEHMVNDNSAKAGMNALEFLLISLFSEYQVFSTCDFRAAIYGFSIQKATSLQWRKNLHLALGQAHAEKQLADLVLNTCDEHLSTIFDNYLDYEHCNSFADTAKN